MISANGGLPAHRYTPQVTPRWPRWSEPASTRTECLTDRSPRGGAQAVLTTQGCKAAPRSSARRRGTLDAPATAAACRLWRHGESSSTRIGTEAMEAPTTPTPKGHHLPPNHDAGPRGPAPNGRTSPPFAPQSSASDRQRFTRAAAGQQTECPARPPPPSQGQRPSRYRGDSAPRTRGQGNPRRPKACARGGGTAPPTTPPSSEAR